MGYLTIILVIFIGWIFIMALTEDESDKSLTVEETTDIKQTSDNVEYIIDSESERIKTNEVEEMANDYEKKEQEEVSKMSEEEREVFYKFKEIIVNDYPKQLAKEMSKQVKFKDKELNAEMKNEWKNAAEKALDNIDFIDLYYASKKKRETEIYMQTILEYYSSDKEIHDLAYALNHEYKIFWDNVDPKAKEKFKFAWNCAQTVKVGRYGLFIVGLAIATFGLSVVIGNFLKNKKLERYKKSITSDAFTKMCSTINRNLDNYNKEKM
jgi:hypothetical protein